MSLEDVRAIQAQVSQPIWSERWSYFKGPHPAIFVTPKHRRVFQAYAERMGERNYCSLAVKARLARLEIIGWDGPDADAAQQVWEASRLVQRQDRMFRWALGYGRAWVVADTAERILIPNKPTLVGAVDDPDDPDQWRVAGKHWVGVDERGQSVQRAVLWYADRSETWRQDSGGEWELTEEVPQPAGRVPVVVADPFGDGPNLIDTISTGQDRINKTGANKMVAGDFAAFAQWVFLTRQDMDDVRSSPGEAIVLDPGEEDWKAAVHQMQYTPLANYDGSKDSEVDDLMSLSSLPRHMRVNPGAAPSGDSIKADEGPLIEDVEDHQRELGESLSDAMGLLDIDAAPMWKDPTPHDDLANAQEFAVLVSGGVPWQMAARKALRWTDEEIAEAEGMMSPATGSPTGAALLALGQEEVPVVGVP